LVETTMIPPIRIVLQARTNSSRLPRKVLLPVGGLPLAVLAARRAMNGGLPLVLATSDHSDDDILARVAGQHGLDVVRGPLDDVLGRFLLAVADLPDKAICVRLTGDNCFPDGAFVAQAVSELLAAGADCIEPQMNGLPYGLGAEAVRVGALRRAAAATIDPYDREHVTPWLIRHAAPPTPAPVSGPLRCTIDTPADYQRIEALFGTVADAVAEPWPALVERLAALPDAPRFALPAVAHGALVLGTVQLGLAYGIANRTGQPSPDEASAILDRAIAHGVACADTARGYGESEERIGSFLVDNPGRIAIITKLHPLPEIDSATPPAIASRLVEASLLRSCHSLHLRQLDCVLLHRAAHLDLPIWPALQAFRDQGLVGRLGASVQTPAELRRALDCPDITHVQMPFNLLDRRWSQAQSWLADRPDVTIHARSALLQGLLTGGGVTWPAIPGVDGAALTKLLTALAAELGRRDVIDLALAFVRGQGWIHGVVVGVETLAQLDDSLALFATPALSAEECRRVSDSLPEIPETLVNPALWPAR
jgi:aryl-alcohol dehydrogenase-like predicted oxidoreductase/spore coat polysaccharide biosynthesis protein SpsF (cytidylyltransferase family)